MQRIAIFGLKIRLREAYEIPETSENQTDSPLTP
jgi:hypothetical protein